MTSFALGRRTLMAAAAAALTFGSPAMAEQALDKVHFLIPGGAGGGWDGTARAPPAGSHAGRISQAP